MSDLSCQLILCYQIQADMLGLWIVYIFFFSSHLMGQCREILKRWDDYGVATMSFELFDRVLYRVHASELPTQKWVFFSCSADSANLVKINRILFLTCLSLGRNKDKKTVYICSFIMHARILNMYMILDTEQKPLVCTELYK